MRWSYEEMIVAQAKLNPLTRRQDRANAEIQKLAPNANTLEQRARVNDLKDVLAFALGSRRTFAKEIDQYLKLVDPASPGSRGSSARFFKDANGPVTAEQIYVNQKVADLISNAEMEQNDYRRGISRTCSSARRNVISESIWRVYLQHDCLIASTLGLLVLLHRFCENNWKSCEGVK